MRDLKVRYKQAALGIAWAIVQPLFAVLVFTLIFGIFARLPTDGVPYHLFAFSAMLPWTFFSEAVRRSALGLVGDASLITKIYFPRLIVPLANVLTPALDFLFALVVFVIFALWSGIYPTTHLLMLPVFIVITLLFGLAVGLWLGPINIRFRDVTHTLPFLLQIWMFATPIVYPLSMVPERWKALYSLNPMVGLIEGFRWALLGRGNPDFHAIGIGVGVTVLLLLGGLLFFRRTERTFADII